MSHPDDLPLAPHDDLPVDEVQLEELRSREAIRAEYEQACTDFRVAASGKLATCGAFEDGQGWAVFDISQEEEGSLAMADGEKDVFLYSFRLAQPVRMLDGHDVPTVRIITNELIVGLSGEMQCLTYDYALDGANDAQYMVDAVNITNAHEYGATMAALFSVDAQGGIHLPTRFLKHGGFPLISDISITGERQCVPFGHWSNLEDKICALTGARIILDQILDKQPTAKVQRPT